MSGDTARTAQIEYRRWLRLGVRLRLHAEIFRAAERLNFRIHDLNPIEVYSDEDEELFDQVGDEVEREPSGPSKYRRTVYSLKYGEREFFYGLELQAIEKVGGIPHVRKLRELKAALLQLDQKLKAILDTNGAYIDIPSYHKGLWALLGAKHSMTRRRCYPESRSVQVNFK